MLGRKDTSEMIISDDDSNDLDSGPPRHVPRSAGINDNNKPAPSERVTWSDDEDSKVVYNAFKKRKVVAQKKTRSDAQRSKAKRSSMVGRNSRAAAKIHDDLDEDDEDSALLEEELPDYLQQRRKAWMKQSTELDVAGLLTPPDYDDVYFSDDERLEKLREKPNIPGIPIPQPYRDIELRYSAGIIPAPIAQYLKPYQIEGTEWLHERFVYQRGGILGDDMGLGKTIQVIAFLTAAFGKTGDERDSKRMRKIRRAGNDRWYPRILIICPGSLIQNWKNELDRWGWWQIYLYHGGGAAKEDALSAAQNGRLEIMITTYSTYRLNEGPINDVRWDCVIADECHIIKERKAEITKSMNRVNALCRIGLSGTAIQNKYEELWTLLNWTSPGALGPIRVWKESICLPLKVGQSHDASLHQLSKARTVATKLVHNLLPRFFLRRTKALIAHQLPKKSDQVVFCPLTEIQADAYNNFCDYELVRAIRDSAEMCNCGSGKKQGYCCYAEIEGFGRWQNFVFPCLVTLQKLANHVALLVPSGKTDRERHDKELEKLEIALPDLWKDLYRQRDNILTYANQDFCGKWKVLKRLLRLWHDNGDKVLVFSHSVRLLRMLEMLFKTTTDYNVSYLDGRMTYEDRQKAVDDYNTEPQQFVFLISTKAGGVGLNITSANKVVVVDPNWNPSYDLQAQDRAYRIGQTRDVEVFRLVSVGTVEEIVYARQIYKQQQANIGYNASVERRYFKGVQDMKGHKGEIFGLTNLFAPQKANVVLRDIVNKTNIAETRAGVEIAGLDVEASQKDEETPDPDSAREDAAISQLAEEIIGNLSVKRSRTKTTTAKRDPVQAILASAGVEYTHENTEVIGTSKIETEISSRAQKAGNDMENINEFAFVRDQSQRAAVSLHPLEQPEIEAFDQSNRELGTGKAKYEYRPPEDIRKRQFCSMAKQFGFDDVTEFALVVESWTQEQRRDCLDQFYRKRRVKLNAVSGLARSRALKVV